MASRHAPQIGEKVSPPNGKAPAGQSRMAEAKKAHRRTPFYVRLETRPEAPRHGRLGTRLVKEGTPGSELAI